MEIEPPLRMQQKAIEIMRTLDMQFKLVAFIVRNGNIISIGTNNVFKTHPKMYRYNPRKCIHAETNAIWKATKNNLKGATLYVFRMLNRVERFALSLPCFVCQHFIREAGIKKVIYTTNNGFASMKI